MLDADLFRDLFQQGGGGQLAAGVEDEEMRTLLAAALQEAGGQGGFADAAEAVDGNDPFVLEGAAEAALHLAAAHVALGQIGDAFDFEVLARDFERRGHDCAPPRRHERSNCHFSRCTFCRLIDCIVRTAQAAALSASAEPVSLGPMRSQSSSMNE